ncbi:hypothetical protein [Micromonospora sp. NPDC047527]|uniref:hypothetical protein n=1 Tax=unclassified Micromonospora TaxID=2617518 RepID=UPI0033E4C3DC
MPARSKPKKSRTPRATPLGIDPAADHSPLPPTRPDLGLAVEPVVPAGPALPLGEPQLPAVLAEPALPLGELAPPVDVPAAVDALAVTDLPKAAGRPTAPTAGPPHGGGGRSGNGKSQQAGQPRRYAFRRS